MRSLATALRAATRGSPMALWQTRFVARTLSAATGHVSGEAPLLGLEEVICQTIGDRRLDLSISSMGGKGVFAKEVQAAVLEGRADIAVHSAKDLPSTTPDGLVIAAVLERDDPRDALVGCVLAELAHGAIVATGSPRRRAQLAWLRPDVVFTEIRGNLGTRLARSDEVDAMVLSSCGFDRLGLSDRIAERLDPATMLPQVGQAVLAVECRADDVETRALLSRVDHQPTRRRFEAERGYLVALGGDCRTPAGAHATFVDPADPLGEIELTALLAAPDGHALVKATRSGRDEFSLGAELAAFLLDEAGGRALLGPPAAG